MQKKIVLTIEGKPLAKSRPRIFSRGGRSFAYDKQSEQMKLMKEIIKSQVHSPLLEGPIIIHMAFHFQVPKYFTKKKFHEAVQKKLWHTKKPDIDNLIKAAADVCTGTVYADDRQIVEIIATKCYSLTDYTVIEIHYDEETKEEK